MGKDRIYTCIKEYWQRMKDFGKKLKAFRLSQGWTRKDLSKLTTISEAAIERWEATGERKQEPHPLWQDLYLEYLLRIVTEEKNPYGMKERLK